MAILDRLFGKSRDRDALMPLYNAIVKKARDPEWYKQGSVPDTQDGRFDMIAAIMSLVLLRLEADGTETASDSALLSEVFIDDMDGQLRQLGVGDVIVGKHVGKMMGALGGRMTAYRQSFAGSEPVKPALERNLYRGEAPDNAALDYTAKRLKELFAALQQNDTAEILAGKLPM